MIGEYRICVQYQPDRDRLAVVVHERMLYHGQPGEWRKLAESEEVNLERHEEPRQMLRRVLRKLLM